MQLFFSSLGVISELSGSCCGRTMDEWLLPRASEASPRAAEEQSRGSGVFAGTEARKNPTPRNTENDLWEFFSNWFSFKLSEGALRHYQLYRSVLARRVRQWSFLHAHEGQCRGSVVFAATKVRKKTSPGNTENGFWEFFFSSFSFKLSVSLLISSNISISFKLHIW